MFLLSSPLWHLEVPIVALRTSGDRGKWREWRIFRRAKGIMKEEGGVGGGGGVECLNWGNDQGLGSRRVWDMH